MRKFALLIFALNLVVSGLFAQKAVNLWKPVNLENINLPEQADRKIQPLKSENYLLDYAGMTAALQQAPMEFTPAATQQPLLLDLPLADGTFRAFRVVEAPVMAPELMAKYPAIRTYSGVAADGSGSTVRLGVGHKGFYSFIFEPDGQIQSVHPYADGMTDLYMAYRVADLPDDPALTGASARCGVEEYASSPTHGFPNPGAVTERGGGNAPVTLKKYRAAISAQGEYSLFHGGTKPKVLSAIVEAINFISAIQERDLAVRLELIPNNDTLIYLDPANDPYSGALVTDWYLQNPVPTNARVTINAYDIGHVFCRVANPSGVYVAGIAQIRGVCTNQKATAGSSLPSPVGEKFYLITAHEMGHQLSATHTFNSCPPSADNVTLATAYEPGGGSTIMSYAGVCAPDIVSDNHQPYYHIGSIEQMYSFVTLEGGSTCGENIATGNHTPDVAIPLTNNFYIPISTPFALTGTATDIDGDNLTYCWEEFDTGPTTPLGQPVLTSPLFRSYLPVSTPTRTFPRIQTIVNNAFSEVEVLPAYSREMKFKFTARDNHPGGGGVSWTQIRFYATDQAGPFTVTYPNSASNPLNRGEYETITWDVANTDKAPVNCRAVNIRLSTDGGFNYPITLAAGVPNIGRCCVKIPDQNITNARIRVEAADNVFFDISNAIFKVQAPTVPNFTLCQGTFLDTICLPAQFSTVISTSASLGFSDLITLAATGLPNGVTASFSPNPVVPGSDAVLTLDLPADYPEGTFDFMINGGAGGKVDSFLTTLVVYNNDFTGLTLAAPADGAAGQDPGPVLSWNAVANANTYEIQVATNPSFDPGSIVSSAANLTGNSFKIPVLLEKGQVYYWRLRPRNECSAGDWVGPFVFATLVDVCAAFEAKDLPKNITANQAVTVESVISVPAGGVVSDVNVTKIQGNHEFFKDLEMHLISPAGTDVLLFKDKCPNFNGNFNFGFDDSKTGLFNCPPPNTGVTYKPAESLGAFNNQNAGGVWTLRVKDNSISSGGKINGFALELCSSTVLNPPVLVNNNTMAVAPGNNKPVSPDLLKTTDANNTDDQLVYTLITIPQHGELHLNASGVKMLPGNSFTQTDLNNGGLQYFDYGTNQGPDQFCFAVTDGEGGLIKDCFTIQPLSVGVQEPGQALGFLLAPNPATGSVRITLSEIPASDTRIRLFDTAGRLLRSEILANGQLTALLQLSGLPGGIYTVMADNSEESGVRKVVVR